MHWLDDATVRTLGAEEAACRLAASRIGSVAVTIDALPAALPVMIACLDGDVVVRVRAGHVLSRAMADRVVSVLAQDIDPDQGTGWTVTVTGIARAVTDPGELQECRALGLLAVGDDDLFIRVRSDWVRGRECTAGPEGRS